MKSRPDNNLENIEKLLEKLAREANPAAEFESRLLSRLRSRWNTLEERSELEKASKGGKDGGFVWSALFSFFRKKAFGPIVALFLVVFTGGISSYAYTSDSVTRESFLYPMKRALEKIERSFVVSTPEDEIDYTVRMMERRLAEVRHLSKKVAGVSGVSETGKTGDSDMLPSETLLPEAPFGPLPETLQEFSEEFDRGLQIVTVIPEDIRRREFFDRFERIVQENESFFPRRPLPSLIHEISTDTVDTAPAITPEDVLEPSNVPAVPEVQIKGRSPVSVPAPEPSRHAPLPPASTPSFPEKAPVILNREIHRRLEQAQESLKLQKQIDRQIRKEVRQELSRLVESKMKSGKIENLKLPLPQVMSPEPPPTTEPKPKAGPEPKLKSGIDLQPSSFISPQQGNEKKIEMPSENHEQALRKEPALIVPSIREIPLMPQSENELRHNRGR